ncbi:hypothetical protein [Streptomyces sp. C10-9-1]|uniref:hypothetical protein n=1 Tax=Streptomyces sp. C10-9-1 TaxID=1859285 RepID=UPI003F49DD8B
MSTSEPIPATDPVLTGALVDPQAVYRCACRGSDFAFSIVRGLSAPPRMQHTGCPAATEGEAHA